MNYFYSEMDGARQDLVDAIKSQVIDMNRIHACFERLVDVFAIKDEDQLLDEALLAAKCAGFEDGEDDERWVWNSALEWWEDNRT